MLEAGGIFGIYPEGTRSPDGRLYKGHTGVARLALACRVPVLAVAMIGTREAQPIGQVRPNLFRPITVKISKPLDFSRYAGLEDDREVWLGDRRVEVTTEPAFAGSIGGLGASGFLLLSAAAALPRFNRSISARLPRPPPILDRASRREQQRFFMAGTQTR